MSTSRGMHFEYLDLGTAVGVDHLEGSLAIDLVLFQERRDLSFTNPSRARGSVDSTSLMPA